MPAISRRLFRDFSSLLLFSNSLVLRHGIDDPEIRIAKHRDRIYLVRRLIPNSAKRLLEIDIAQVQLLITAGRGIESPIRQLLVSIAVHVQR